MPTPSDRLTAAVESLFPRPDVTSPTPDPAHRLATAPTRHECNHSDLADELENIAEDLHVLVSQLRRFEWEPPPVPARDQWGRLPPRAVHVEVDDEARALLRAELARTREWAGVVVGQLCRNAVGRRRHIRRDDEQSPEVIGRRAKVFVRLREVDDDTWRAFKATALEHHVTAARMVGRLIEAEARRRGCWMGC